jgi:hypothetical protein
MFSQRSGCIWVKNALGFFHSELASHFVCKLKVLRRGGVFGLLGMSSSEQFELDVWMRF